MERDGVIVKVEVRWISSHENITDNEVIETGWEVHGLDTKEAFGLTEGGNLENVVLSTEWIVLSIKGESNIWKGIETRAVSVDGDSINELVNNSLWSDKEGSSRVDDGLDVTGWDNLGSLVHGIHLECPVFLFNNLVGLNNGVVLRVHSWDDHI